jgi:ectoine hydroxylase-related dioxygenase (phytanoyl-CoA dioxygenase family)
VPFDDADVENGCLQMVPGSQRWGDQIEELRRMNEGGVAIPPYSPLYFT